jgi:hypothetical protein
MNLLLTFRADRAETSCAVQGELPLHRQISSAMFNVCLVFDKCFEQGLAEAQPLQPEGEAARVAAEAAIKGLL